MLKKFSFSQEGSIEKIEPEEIKASPYLLDRMDKLAHQIKKIAPKSDDFLYFSIIFLKAAEACLIDDKGSGKKIAGGESAWGYFDDSWKWHGNTSPHRNNNKDIFPESELRKAAKDWIGMPLCRDHESSSVDGIRGIILDTHYDEKLKQVVGLCALDKINYPDLARKVETGLVRYGSMGTAVETSVCSDCGNRAQTQEQYCEHVNNKTAWGEINVGLKPIEYSLVVQPAEPGAVLLRCIASLKEYKKEFVEYGVENVDNMLGALSEGQAENLEKIMKTACGDNGCSINERRKIVRSFLLNNSLVKKSHSESTMSLDEAEKASNIVRNISGGKGLERILERPDSPESLFLQKLELFGGNVSTSGEREVSTTGDQLALTGESVQPDEGSQQDGMSPRDLTGSSGPMVASTDGEPRVDTFDTGGVIERNVFTNLDDNQIEKKAINSILEEIMNEARLRKRAELRRRIAYHQGGSDGVEPSGTYTDEKALEGRLRGGEDRQMKQTKSMGGDSGMFPGDEQVKQKLSRAELEERRLRRMAYHQGGSDGVEPNTYKDEKALEGRLRGEDRQMKQTKSMGGDSGMFPGDEQVKQKLSRAKYNGPSLRTKFSARTDSGRLNKSASVFEVYAGSKRVLSATAGEIFGDELSDNWNWISSKEYGQEVCKQIRAHGLSYVGGLLKSAQDAAAPPLPPAPEGGDLPPLPGGDMAAEPMPDMGGDLPPLPGEGDEVLDDDAELSPKEQIEEALVEVEERVDEVRDLLAQLGDGQDVDIDIAVSPDGADMGGEEDVGGLPALANELVSNLKTAMSELNESADELALIAETFDGEKRLTASQRGDLRKIASDALRDSHNLNAETKALVRVAGGMAKKAFDFGEIVGMGEEKAKEGADWLSEKLSGFLEENDATIEDLKSMLGMGSDEGVEYDEGGAWDAVEEASGEAWDAVSGTAKRLYDSAMGGGDDESELMDSDLMSEAMDLRRQRREQILKNAEDLEISERKAKREELLKGAGSAWGDVSDSVENAVNELADAENDMADKEDDMADAENELADKEDDMADAESDASDTVTLASTLKGKLQTALDDKRAEEERDAYKLKLRRAYDVSMEMQRKGLIAQTKPALDRQVDEVMQFDSNAFEAFKRTISSTRPVSEVKIASDLGGVNIGVDSSEQANSGAKTTVDILSAMWK